VEKEQLQQLLNNFDYRKALAVYLPHCTNPTLKKLLERSTSSPNTFTIKKLKEGIRFLIDRPDPQLPQVLVVHTSQPSTGPAKDQIQALQEAYRKAPAEVQLKISERIHLVAEARVLKINLPKMDDLARRNACIKIAELWQEAHKCYEYEQYWNEHEELPIEIEIDNEIVLPEGIVDLLKRRQTLRTYKSRKSNWSKYEDEFKAIENRLKELNAI
jgi:hypothetical protein